MGGGAGRKRLSTSLEPYIISGQRCSAPPVGFLRGPVCPSRVFPAPEGDWEPRTIPSTLTQTDSSSELSASEAASEILNVGPISSFTYDDPLAAIIAKCGGTIARATILDRVIGDSDHDGDGAAPSLNNRKAQPFKRPSRRQGWYQWWQKNKESYLSYFNCIHLRHISDKTTLESSSSNPSWWLNSALIQNLESSGKYWYRERRPTLPPSTDSPLCGNLVSGESRPMTETLSSFDPHREVEGDYEYRMRLKGCGDRVVAPIEGTYYCDSLANDAIAVTKGIVNALGMEGKLQCYGGKWVFTIPKKRSAKLDAIRGTDKWRKKINKLFNAAADVIKKQHPEGEVSMVSSLHLSGEEKP